MKKLLIVLLLLSFGRIMAQTELYSRYASHKDIKVACVNNMLLDSTSHIEVTILEANDASGWDWILNEFAIGAQPEGHSSIMFSMRDRHDPSKSAPIKGEQVDEENSCYIGVDFKNQTLYVFAALSGTLPDVLLKYLVARMVQ